MRKLSSRFYRLTAAAAAVAALIALLIFPLVTIVAILAAVASFLRSRRREVKVEKTTKAPASKPEPARAAPAHQEERLGLLAGLTRLSLNRKPVVFLAAGVIALLGV
ncbi:MAG TPA: hypothetical protein VLS25_10275, partial [Dehalococcoidia bacterium]|nr:hypothetical protein [Dehalococcoidia bacterium]